MHALCAESVNIRACASDIEHGALELDAGVDFGGQHEADEGIRQRNEVRIRRQEKTREILEGNGCTADVRQLPPSQLHLDYLDRAPTALSHRTNRSEPL